MTKKELVKSIAQDSGVTISAANKCLNSFTRTVACELNQGGSVPIAGFGKFSVKLRAARKGRNPSTGEVITIPAKRTVRFKPSKILIGE